MIASPLIIKSVVDVGKFTSSSISKFSEHNPRDVSFIWIAAHLDIPLAADHNTINYIM